MEEKIIEGGEKNKNTKRFVCHARERVERGEGERC